MGLGNPGAEYEGSRHNVGADCVRLLADRHGAALRSPGRQRAVVSVATLAGRRLALAVPTTYYNDSGLVVLPLVERFGIEDPARLVVIHDELDLPSGRIRLKQGGGLAGNKGLKSIQSHLGTDEFSRIRIGIGKPPGRQAGADYVLKRPGKAERDGLDVAIHEAADAVETILAAGMPAAMNRFNRSPEGSDGD